MSDDQNMNELRNLPADIDLLISAAKQTIRCGINEKLPRRIDNLAKIVDRVEKQYKQIMET